ncbi:MAG: discoidin domain-containing protein [Planctomycetota bacterium]
MTSDLSAVIEEIVGQSGWASGNALVLIFNQDPDNPSTTHRTSHKAASADVAPVLHIEYTLGNATEPNPADTQADVSRDTDLSWKAGLFAAATNGHTVYLSEGFNDVNDGIGGITQSATSYDPGRLNYGTTYYWRIRENNGPPDFGVNEGRVWSFRTEFFSYPIGGANINATASSLGQPDFGPENTINGSGLDENDLHSTDAADMWLSGTEPQGAWIQYELDKVYKLHEMWVWNSNQVFEALFGFGMKDVTVEYSTNGAEWTILADAPEFAKAPGTADYAHNTTVDFGGAPAKYVKLTASSNWGGVLPQYSVSEVRFFYIPVNPAMPSPASGATDVDVVGATLSWRGGREAARHDVSFSADEQAVIDGTAPVASAATASFTPPALDLSTSYYWKVGEVNEAETPSTWESNVWSFTTSDYIVVEDFEDYNDYPGYEIYTTWLDGYENPANGSQVGNLSPPLAETTIVRGGKQSMPLFYSNTGGATFSEGERTFAVPQDWTKHGIQTLVVHFQGTPGNTGQLYVKVNGVKVAYPGDAADIARPRWNQWGIDLASLGVNLASVTKLALGIDGNGAGGTLYVDDIVLYRLAPDVVVPSEEIWIEAEAAATITAPMQTYDDPVASGGKYIGTENGIGDENDTAPADGVATYNFTAQGGVYTISLRVIITGGSNSFWVRIPTATSQTHEDPDQPGTGWIRFNDISDGANWHWDEVHSNDHGDEVVSITVPAGQHTLEIARREDGALLDVIVITKID